jgi:hypothetical protein
VQRPDVDDTDRRATQPPAHFRRVLRSFAFGGPTAHRSRGRQNPLSCFIFSSCRHSKKACKAGALQSGMITKARSSCKRHCFHSEPDAGCCSDTCSSQQSIGHRGYGPVAGAMAMAAGEYVSVHFQGTWESSSLLTDGALAKWEASQELEVPFFQQMARAE